ncbi:MAG: tyrosine-type recombinase/integrase [Ignavibacteriales bacterium]|nr:tyrosine-type recombinase/integrase [Ignavibacteriales bacterium]
MNLKALKDIHRILLSLIEKILLGFLSFCQANQKNDVESITNKFIKHYLMHLNELGLDKRSIARKLASTRGLFKYAFQRGILESNPSLQISNPKLDRKLPEVVPLDSFLKIYNIADEAEENPIIVKVIFEILYGCALRVSELCGINNVDVDLKGKVIKIRGKGNKERIVPLGDKSLEIIQAYMLWRKDFTSTNAFLLNEKGERIYPRYVYRLVHKYLAKVSDIKKKSPHVLRHTAATHMLDRGADIRAVKEILGHENLSTTQIYTHVSIEKVEINL